MANGLDFTQVTLWMMASLVIALATDSEQIDEDFLMEFPKDIIKPWSIRTLEEYDEDSQNRYYDDSKNSQLRRFLYDMDPSQTERKYSGKSKTLQLNRRLSDSDSPQIERRYSGDSWSPQQNRRLSDSDSPQIERRYSGDSWSPQQNRRLSDSDSPQIERRYSGDSWSPQENRRLSDSDSPQIERRYSVDSWSPQQNRRLSDSGSPQIERRYSGDSWSPQENRRLSDSDSPQIEGRYSGDSWSPQLNRRLSDSGSPQIERRYFGGLSDNESGQIEKRHSGYTGSPQQNGRLSNSGSQQIERNFFSDSVSSRILNRRQIDDVSTEINVSPFESSERQQMPRKYDVRNKDAKESKVNNDYSSNMLHSEFKVKGNLNGTKNHSDCNRQQKGSSYFSDTSGCATKEELKIVADHQTNEHKKTKVAKVSEMPSDELLALLEKLARKRRQQELHAT